MDQLRATDASQMGGWLAIIGGLLVAIGAFLPWFTGTVIVGSSFNPNGFQLGNQNALTFDGPVCLLLAIVMLVIGILRLKCGFETLSGSHGCAVGALTLCQPCT
jgi:hypothetical protein